MKQLLLILVGLSLAVAFAAPHVRAGSIELTNTIEAGRVVVHLRVVDDGEASLECSFFELRGGGLYSLVPREPGTHDYEFVDATVQPNTTYFYVLEMASWFGGSCNDVLTYEFGADWYPGFTTIANVGPGPIPQRRGTLVTGESDPWTPFTLRDACHDPRNSMSVGLSSQAQQYVDTNVVVLTYGTWFEISRQHGFALRVESAVPTDCPNLAVESRPWSGIKVLYR